MQLKYSGLATTQNVESIIKSITAPIVLPILFTLVLLKMKTIKKARKKLRTSPINLGLVSEEII